MYRLMITAASSNSGKTAVTCGLLALLKRRGLDPCAFKCGPDYIDPMFHRSVLGIDSSNLDVFLAGEEGVRSVFARGCRSHESAVCEGVMGYYDGMTERPSSGTESEAAGTSSTGASARASAWHVATLLQIPSILVLRPKGAALTLAAVIRGLLEFRSPSQISGVIFNDCSEMFVKTYGPSIEAETGVPVLGYLPHMEEAAFESRHLGLMTAEEIGDLSERIDRIGRKMEETIDVDRLLAIAKAGEGVVVDEPEPGAPHDTAEHETAQDAWSQENSDLPAEGDRVSVAMDQKDTDMPMEDEGIPVASDRKNSDTSAGDDEFTAVPDRRPVRIAVAKDEAFNFIYAESIAAIRRAGGEIVYFSPLHDLVLPEGVQGLYLPGGYPELYGKQLSENAGMRSSIREAVGRGLPTIAECGGFLYLSMGLEDAEGESWPMAGALPGLASGTGRLVRFGYGKVSCDEDSMLFRAGEEVPVHEFHYWDTTQPGKDLHLTKQSNGKQWKFGYAGPALYAGFPHLYLAGGGREKDGAKTLADRFVQTAREYRS